jgi:hypothetical protein
MMICLGAPPLNQSFLRSAEVSSVPPPWQDKSARSGRSSVRSWSASMTDPDRIRGDKPVLGTISVLRALIVELDRAGAIKVESLLAAIDDTVTTHRTSRVGCGLHRGDRASRRQVAGTHRARAPYSRNSNSPPLEDWLPLLKSTVSFLRRTDGRSKGSGVSSGMAAVAVGRCTSQFVGTPICYVNRRLHATVAAKFSRS